MPKQSRHMRQSETDRDVVKLGPTTADLRGIAAPEIRDDRRQAADRRRDSGERRLDRPQMGQDLELNPEELDTVRELDDDKSR